MLNDVMANVVMLNCVIVSVIMLSVAVLNVVMLSVVAPIISNFTSSLRCEGQYSRNFHFLK
jgi:hypothetical protein